MIDFQWGISCGDGVSNYAGGVRARDRGGRGAGGTPAADDQLRCGEGAGPGPGGEATGPAGSDGLPARAATGGASDGARRLQGAADGGGRRMSPTTSTPQILLAHHLK